MTEGARGGSARLIGENTATNPVATVTAGLAGCYAINRSI